MTAWGHERPTLLPRRHRYDSNTLESRHYFLVGLGHMLVVLSNRGVRLMSDNVFSAAPRRTPWNKGKLIGARPPLRPKHVWSIRTRLLVEGRIRDLAMFDLAIDSKLRGCDVVAVRVEDVAPSRLGS